MMNIPFNFGNNLIDIAAVTTIVGAMTAESLALGSRGAAGLPWAGMSAFGSLFLLKACITGPMPGWFCEALGINSSLYNSILGVGAAQNKKTLLKVNPTGPIGISIHRVSLTGEYN